jgi:hypothetical protein
LSIENLLFNLTILLLLIAKKRERLKEKQIQKGVLKRKQTKCTNCLQLSYNKRHYIAQLAQNRRAERAQNWDILSSDLKLKRELAPFIEQVKARARAKAKAKAKAILAERVKVKATVGATVGVTLKAGDNESKLLDL